MYKPYSPEWHRRRYLDEAIQKYIEDGESSDVILDDLKDVLLSWIDHYDDKSTTLKEVFESLPDK